MKINVDIDCTPQEARNFLGLPDLTPIHDAYLDQMKKAISEGISPDMIETMMRNWAPFGEAGMGMWRKMFEQMSGTGTSGA
jgi:hypothetical protein